MTRTSSLTTAIRTLLRTLVPVSAAGMVALGVMTAITPGTAQASSRIKDIVDVEGVRENMLIGYGLVVGLNGTGDSLGNSPFTEQSLIGMLERMGVNTRGQSMWRAWGPAVAATVPASLSNQRARLCHQRAECLSPATSIVAASSG